MLPPHLRRAPAALPLAPPARLAKDAPSTGPTGLLPVTPFANSLTGVGAPDDPLNATYLQFTRLLNRVQVETAVTGCGEARRLCYAIPEDAFAAGVTITDDTDVVEPLKADLKRLNLPAVWEEAAKYANQYGETFLLPILWEDGEPPDLAKMRRPLDLRRVTRVERFELVLGALAREVTVTERQNTLVGPTRTGDPLVYRVTIARAGPILGPVDVHTSRLFRFQGDRVSPKMQIATSLYLPGEAISVLQAVIYALYGWLESGASNRRAQQEVSEKVLRTSAVPAPDAPSEYLTAIYSRWAALSLTSSLRTTVVDAGNTKTGDPGETLERLNFPVAGLADLDDGALTHLAAAKGWPKERLAGLQPTGIINSGPSWESSWWSIVAQEREAKYRAPMEQTIALLYAANGQHDVEWSLEFNPLGAPGPLDEAQIEKVHAETCALYVDMGALPTAQVRRSLFGPEATPPGGLQPATEEEMRAPTTGSALPLAVRSDPVARAQAARDAADEVWIGLEVDPAPIALLARALAYGSRPDPWPHVTLAYPGAVRPRDLPALLAAVAAEVGTVPSVVVPDDVGPLGEDGAQVVFLRSGGLRGLADRLLRATYPYGHGKQFPRFIPHITVGYGPGIGTVTLPESIAVRALVVRVGDRDLSKHPVEG